MAHSDIENSISVRVRESPVFVGSKRACTYVLADKCIIASLDIGLIY